MATFGSLFAGIGGIDLGLERAGWECRWQVEWDAYCQRVLAKHWPDVPQYGDITEVDWSGVARVDLLAGGFPCQPVSSAGRQAAQEDPRWLWPEFYRAIRELRPPLVLVENVTNLLAVNGGSAFGDVLSDLATSGYDAEWDCVPASAIGALHERDRVWLVAYPNGVELRNESRRSIGARRQGSTLAGHDGAASSLADTYGNGLSVKRGDVRGNGHAPRGRDANGRRGPLALGDSASVRLEEPRWLGFARDREASIEGQANHAVDAGGWAVEPEVGRVVDGLSRGLARWRTASLEALGNAVVPQVVEVIGRRLLEVMDDTACITDCACAGGQPAATCEGDPPCPRCLAA